MSHWWSSQTEKRICRMIPSPQSTKGAILTWGVWSQKHHGLCTYLYLYPTARKRFQNHPSTAQSDLNCHLHSSAHTQQEVAVSPPKKGNTFSHRSPLPSWHASFSGTMGVGRGKGDGDPPSRGLEGGQSCPVGLKGSLASGSHASSPHWGSLLGPCPTHWPWPPLPPPVPPPSMLHPLMPATPPPRLERLRQACRPPCDPWRKREQWSWACPLTTLQFSYSQLRSTGALRWVACLNRLPALRWNARLPSFLAPTDLNLLPPGHSIPRLLRQEGTVQMYNKPFAPPQILFLVKWQKQDWN